jgi:hypothetical protein
MARVTFRHRDSEKSTKGITVVHSPKGTKLHKKLKLYKIIGIVSVIINIILLIKVLY